MEQPGANSSERGETTGGAELFADRLFMGPDGLRAGWRLALYIAAFYFLSYGIAFVLGPLFDRIPDGRMHTPYLLLIADCIGLVAALVPAVAMAKLEERPFSAYGLPLIRTANGNFWKGAAWGILSLTMLLAIMRAAGVFHLGAISLHGGRMLKFAAFWGFTFLVVAFYEEFLMRGYVQFTLTDGIGFWPAAVVLSIVFGAQHLLNPGENWQGALGAGIIGLFWCFTLRRTGTLWFGLGMHAAWDWSETFLYAAPDSGIVAPGHLFNSTFQGPRWLTGGTVGPEASVFLLVVMAALWVLFDRLYADVKYKSA